MKDGVKDGVRWQTRRAEGRPEEGVRWPPAARRQTRWPEKNPNPNPNSDPNPNSNPNPNPNPNQVEADGERYHGEFAGGERSGAGRLRHSNGDVFD